MSKQLVDPKPATYFFDYDALNRKIGATYPMDATQTVRSESWHYDFAGNMDQYTNPAGQIKTLGYDTRNRLYTSSWNVGGGPTLGLGYYNNSQLGIIVTYVGGNPETTVVFGYDDANRQTWEEQTVAGFPTRRVETPRDNDGFRNSLNAQGAYAFIRLFEARPAREYLQWGFDTLVQSRIRSSREHDQTSGYSRKRE